MILRKSIHALYTWDDYTCEWPRRPHHHHHLLSAHFIIWPLSLLSGERKMCRSFISAGGLSKLFLSVQMSMCDQWLVASGQHSLLVLSLRRAPQWRGWPSVQLSSVRRTGDRVRPSYPNLEATNMSRTRKVERLARCRCYWWCFSTQRSSPPSGAWGTWAWGGGTGWWGTSLSPPGTLQYKCIIPVIPLSTGEEHQPGKDGYSKPRSWNTVVIISFSLDIDSRQYSCPANVDNWVMSRAPQADNTLTTQWTKI